MICLLILTFIKTPVSPFIKTGNFGALRTLHRQNLQIHLSNVLCNMALLQDRPRITITRVPTVDQSDLEFVADSKVINHSENKGIEHSMMKG